jgi:hypothetical protein
VVNLARLHIRCGDGRTAAELLTIVHEAVAAAKPVLIDGQELRLDRLTSTVDDRRTVARWLWTVRLADGIRALTTAGDWHQAAAYARRCDGIGNRLLDGRQTVILARLLSGNARDALDSISKSTVSEPWEQAVQSCLELLSFLTSDQPTRNPAAKAITCYHTIPAKPELILFRTRIGVATLELADAANHSGSGQLVTELADQVIQSSDGYAAREVLTEYRSRLSRGQTIALESRMEASGLDIGVIPNALLSQLNTALETCRNAAANILTKRLAGHQ